MRWESLYFYQMIIISQSEHNYEFKQQQVQVRIFSKFETNSYELLIYLNTFYLFI